MKIRNVSRVLSLLAGVLIGLMVVVVPLGFFLISYNHEKGSIETEVVIKAEIISRLVSVNPRFWKFESIRIQEMISEHKPHRRYETQRVFDGDNELVAENKADIRPPLIRETANVYDSGVAVGRVEITRSLFPILKKTALILLVLLPAGVGGFLVLYLIPIRMLHRAGEDLRKSEEKYRRLIEIANDAIFVADAETGIILDANRKAEDLIGKPLNHIIGMHQSKLHPPEDEKRYRTIFMESVTKGSTVLITDLYVHNSEGRNIPVDISASVMELEGKKVIQGIFRDVTERKRTEETLRASQARYAEAAEVAHLGHWERDYVTSQGYWSQEIFAIFGVSPDAFNPDFDNFMRLVHPQDRESVKNAVDASLATGETLNIEYRVIRPDGDTRVVHSRAEVRFNEKGEKVRLTGTIQDITERKHIEESLLWAEQLNIVSQIAKGLAEDIKNSLAGIRAYIEVLASDHTFSSEDKATKENAMNEIERIKATLNSLIYFAKPVQPELMPVNINDVLDQTISFSLKHPSFSKAMLSKVTFVRQFDKAIPDTLADPLQLQQIFLNLIFNAFEAMPSGGAITILTAYDRQLNSIQVVVADTGGGIDEKLKDRIFEPFFTTKPKGTGLGLPITMKMIRQCGGNVQLDSDTSGTVVTITYPVKN